MGNKHPSKGTGHVAQAEPARTKSYDSIHVHMTMYHYVYMFGHFLTIAPPVCSLIVLQYVLCSQFAIVYLCLLNCSCLEDFVIARKIQCFYTSN